MDDNQIRYLIRGRQVACSGPQIERDKFGKEGLDAVLGLYASRAGESIRLDKNKCLTHR